MSVKHGQLHYDFTDRCVVTVNGCSNTAGQGVRINGAVYGKAKIMRFRRVLNAGSCTTTSRWIVVWLLQMDVPTQQVGV